LPRRAVVAAFFSLTVIAGLGLLASPWLEEQQAGRALAAHLEQGTRYAARALEVLGTLPAELNESSGLAVSRNQPGVLWSHNDSGDGPTVYAIDQSGRLLAVVPLAGAAARDWEDMSSGPCPAGSAAAASESCLYLADIGDNDRTRTSLTVYVVVEPLLDRTATKPPPVNARSFRYRYPNGPDDSEAIAVLPDGDVTIVTKGRKGTIEFFRLSGADVARAITSGEMLTAEPAGDAGITPDGRIGRQVTGAAVSPDGTTLAVRTYNEVFFYGRDANASANRWRDLGRPCSLGSAEPQGEAIAFLDDETMLLTSETTSSRAGMIHRLRC
jgi:DNA-binding beta-propeller fold protein YncE